MGGIGDIVFTFLVFVGVVLAVRAVVRAAGRRSGSMPREMAERMETLFKASFPELQPHFHPARVHQFVKERVARKAPSRDTTWKNPPGFPAAAAAEIELDGLRDKVRLVDAAGATLADFIYEEHPEGGVLRYGKGKFTVNVKGPQPRVRYWHPEREFKWTPTGWKMDTRLADQSLESSDRSSSDSSSSSSSSSSISRGAAAGAAAGGIIAAGGTFDGGGASAAWDEGGGAGGSSSGSDASPDFSSVESGSSSSSSTGY